MANRRPRNAAPTAPRPKVEQGTSGVAVSRSGYITTTERSPSLSGPTKYITFADLATNVSIVAASLRFFTALVTKSAWNVIAVSDDAEAQRYADLAAQLIMQSTDQPWNRIVRRASTFRFWGFSMQEWIVDINAEGQFCYRSIEHRPQSTFERWDVDDGGTLMGAYQRRPLDGQEFYLPRGKCLYLVDDLLTDSPEGLGFLRHVAEPAAKLRVFENLEQQGFERDLRGIPVGRAPLAALEQWAGNDPDRKAAVAAAIHPIQSFVAQQMKGSTTGLMLDSQPYEALDEDGNRSPSAALQWGMELLEGSAPGLADAANAINRKNMEMARIMGTEGLLLGADGSGSLALSRDKTSSLLLNVNSTIIEIVDQASKDLIDPLWTLNNFPPEMKPRFGAEEISQLDAEAIAGILRDMATAGAVLSPDDPAVDEMRELIGFSKSVPLPIETPNDRVDALGEEE